MKHYDLEEQKNGMEILYKIGAVVHSVKTERQLVVARDWYLTLCERFLWLNHHRASFQYLLVTKHKYLKKHGSIHP